MSNSKNARRKHRRIVLKFGSTTLTRTNAPGLDLKQFPRHSAEVVALIHCGYECVTVTSGAAVRHKAEMDRFIDLIIPAAVRR